MTFGVKAYSCAGIDAVQLDLDVVEADHLAAQAARLAGAAASPDT